MKATGLVLGLNCSCWCEVDKWTQSSAREAVLFCCCMGFNAAQVITRVSLFSTVQSCDGL